MHASFRTPTAKKACFLPVLRISERPGEAIEKVLAKCRQVCQRDEVGAVRSGLLVRLGRLELAGRSGRLLRVLEFGYVVTHAAVSYATICREWYAPSFFEERVGKYTHHFLSVGFALAADYRQEPMQKFTAIDPIVYAAPSFLIRFITR
jgi:hypothetical protein